MVYTALDAAKELEKEGIDLEVSICVRFCLLTRKRCSIL